MKAWLLTATVLLAGCATQHPATRFGGAAILAHVPADTPYVLAGLEPLPEDYLAHYFDEQRPQIDRALATLRQLRESQKLFDVSFLIAFLEEIQPRFSPAGMRELGLSARPRGVIYGVGLTPVIRVELADPALFAAFLERLIAKSGAQPVRGNEGGRRSWSFHLPLPSDPIIVATIDGGELMVTGAPRAMIAAHLARVWAGGPSLAGTGTLEAIARANGYTPQFVGFIDTARVLAAIDADRDLLNAYGAEVPAMPPPCRDELRALSATAPRVVMGMTDLAAGRARFAATIELRPELARDLAAARVAMPGVGAPLENNVVTMAVAFDLPAAARALQAEAQRVARGPRQCALLAHVTKGAEEMARALSEPLGAPWSSLRGFAAALDSADVTLGMPQIKGYGLIAATDPIRLIDLARQAMPALGSLKVPEDGTPVALPSGAIPFMPEAHVAMRGQILGLSLGAGMQLALARFMALPAHPARALASFAYDEEKLGALLTTIAGHDSGINGKSKVGLVLEAGERGLIMRVDATWSAEVRH